MATSATAEKKTLLCRMIDMGRDPQLCMKFMALWIWLESNYKEFEQLVEKISSHSDEFIFSSVLEETEAILSSLELCSVGTSSNGSSSLGMKTTLRLAQRFLTISAIIGDREKIYKAIVTVHNEVCCVVFKDVLEERKIRACLIEEKKGNSAGNSKLNPFAKEWTFSTQRAPEEERSLFLTFSNGQPITENQIFRFFSQKYGKCVERVYVHLLTKTKKNEAENMSASRGSEYFPALFGKVVFNKSSIPAMILRGHNKVKLFVDHNIPLWCKKYEPKTKTNDLVLE